LNDGPSNSNSKRSEGGNLEDIDDEDEEEEEERKINKACVQQSSSKINVQVEGSYLEEYLSEIDI